VYAHDTCCNPIGSTPFVEPNCKNMGGTHRHAHTHTYTHKQTHARSSKHTHMLYTDVMRQFTCSTQVMHIHTCAHVSPSCFSVCSTTTSLHLPPPPPSPLTIGATHLGGVLVFIDTVLYLPGTYSVGVFHSRCHRGPFHALSLSCPLSLQSVLVLWALCLSSLDPPPHTHTHTYTHARAHTHTHTRIHRCHGAPSTLSQT
jgi:hypothetical protein